MPIVDLLIAILAGLVGSLIGAYLNYYLSLKLGEPFLRKYGKWFFIKPEALDRACEVFNKYGNVTTFVCRLIPVIRQLISIPAGLAKMPLGSFTFFTGLGAGIWTAILAFVGYGIIGFIDDYPIAIKKNNDGLKASHKLGLQILLAVVFFFLYRSHARLEVIIPFSGHVIHLGWWYFLLILFMFAGASNAVNLTDGMDGLAAGVSFIAFIPYLVFAFLQARDGLQMFIITLMGALAGYLYYNKKPAKVFMGDSGALALGGALAACAMVTKTELLLILIAAITVGFLLLY
jgi:UDP-N-acetylmuramyl pentapeptide phosphotransferase/UDP-N-acetylglucosamine-1-phosphate transferase